MLKKLVVPLLALPLAGCFDGICTDDAVQNAITEISYNNRGYFGQFWFFAENNDLKTTLTGVEKLKESKDSATCSADLTVQNTKNGEIVQRNIKYVITTLPDRKIYVNVYGLR